MKKEKNIRSIRENKGITLIALVITVIILIILATLTIDAAFGENGLINSAQQAKNQTEQIVDNSEINEFENRGQYYRSTFEIVVDEAQIFMVKTTDYNKIKVTLKSYDAEGVEFDSEEIYNYSQEP